MMDASLLALMTAHGVGKQGLEKTARFTFGSPPMVTAGLGATEGGGTSTPRVRLVIPVSATCRVGTMTASNVQSGAGQ